MNLGDTFYQDHLWVVSSLPTDDGSIVILNFTSWRSGCDENCIIEPGEHSFVHNKTVIAYERAIVLDVQQQKTVVSLCPSRDAVSPVLLKRIQEGALVSDLSSPKIQGMIKASMDRQARGER